jgi:hypothetical protein
LWPVVECFRLALDAFSSCFLFDCVICWYFIDMLWRATESLGRLALLFLSRVFPLLSYFSGPLELALLSLSRCELMMFCFLAANCWGAGYT